jgi:hypothetical protein
MYAAKLCNFISERNKSSLSFIVIAFFLIIFEKYVKIIF